MKKQKTEPVKRTAKKIREMSAKWLGGIALHLLTNNAWAPDIDYAHLTLLEDEIIYKLKVFYIEINCLAEDKWTYRYTYPHDRFLGRGKSIHKAKLDAIMNYIEKELNK